MPIGILGDGRRLGQHIQTGKESDPKVETQVVAMGQPFLAQEF